MQKPSKDREERFKKAQVEATRKRNEASRRRKRGLINPIRAFALEIGIPEEEFEKSLVPQIEGLIGEIDDGDLVSPKDILDEELVNGMVKNLTDDGVTFGKPIPDEDDYRGHRMEFEKNFNRWQTNFDERLNQLLGVITFVLFRDQLASSGV